MLIKKEFLFIDASLFDFVTFVVDDFTEELLSTRFAWFVEKVINIGRIYQNSPSAIKMMRSATRAKPISWVTTIIFIPSGPIFCITARTSPMVSGSRADVGSSKRRSPDAWRVHERWRSAVFVHRIAWLDKNLFVPHIYKFQIFLGCFFSFFFINS